MVAASTPKQGSSLSQVGRFWTPESKDDNHDTVSYYFITLTVVSEHIELGVPFCQFWMYERILLLIWAALCLHFTRGVHFLGRLEFCDITQ